MGRSSTLLPKESEGMEKPPQGSVIDHGNKNMPFGSDLCGHSVASLS